MLINLLSNFLSPVLLGLGFLLLVPLSVFAMVKKSSLSPRAKSHLWFWRTIGFWCLAIGTFMVASNVIKNLLD